MDVGIVSYGAYVPRYRIKPEEIGRIWGVDGKGMGKGLMINQKSVPSPDEDVVTIATEAARNAKNTDLKDIFDQNLSSKIVPASGPDRNKKEARTRASSPSPMAARHGSAGQEFAHANIPPS